MATQNASNQKFTNQADGFVLGGGTAQRNLTVTGANVTLTGSGSNTHTFPSASDTLVGRSSTDTLTNKTINLASNTLSGTTAQFNTALSDGDFAILDANNNFSADAFFTGFTTTATSGITTTLTVNSTQVQVFTGATTQTVVLPTTSLPAGAQYYVINNSTGAVTVQSSGLNTITILAGSTSGRFTALIATPTTAANWEGQYMGGIYASGKSLTVNNSLVLSGTDGTVMTFPAVSGNVVTEGATQTLAAKTLTTPTISSTGFTNAQHAHTGATSGGQITDAALSAAVTVAKGGTGRTTLTTAYGLLAAGTTATGNVQTLAAGATTDILVGGGASALPVWTAATGSGSPVRATSPTLTAPRIANGGFIADANGNEQIIFTTTASAVNEITIANAAAGADPVISASGGGTDIGFTFQVKGAGQYGFRGTASGPAQINLFEDTDNGTNRIGLSAPASIASNRIVTLPDASTTLVGTDTTDALSNKTLSSPTFSGAYSFGGTPTWPTFNQNTTGSAATLTTSRTFQTNLASTSSASFNGSADVTPGVTGTLAVGNGGTGAATLTGIIKGNGTSAFTAATAGTDYVTPTGSETLTNKTLTNPTVNSYTEGVVAIGTVTTTHTLNLTNGTIHTATLTASTTCTFTMPTAAAGKSFVLFLNQAASTGNGTATFTSVKWNAGGTPTITPTAGKMDILSFFSNGTSWFGSYSQGYDA